MIVLLYLWINDICIKVHYIQQKGTREMLGKNESYFVHVQVANIYQNDKEIFEFGSAFYIVSENEVLLETEDGWYKMKRLNFLPGYPDIIRFV